MIFLWLITGDLPSLNDTALILLGVSTATISTSGIVNNNDGNNTAPDNSSVTARLRHKKKAERSYFLKDILSDTNGVNIQRLQALVFNLIFGVAFFKSVMTDYVMPEFSSTQLVLMGLSNGTYAFLKTTENK